ncbi:SAM-dependent methyltransferase [Oenococcus oeni]|uniref:SAM-dependent methyltransferase n=1 Tax=Oenococcus oeni TaxID=1247 RepID=UPI0010B1B481|nr:cyclopropane-fatty-acyl-phospholipid synthase family protein [Oenococcus oeni]SYW20331.1 putative Cyclopropane-fatty-acyl-phospholipid synthase (cfa) [Oenococcus oeni]
MLEKTIYRRLLSRAFDIPVTVTYWDGKTEAYGTGKPKIGIEIKKEITIKNLTSQPTLTLGEAYMRGDIEINGSIQELVASAYRNAGSFLTDKKFVKFLPKMSHSEEADKKDVQSHYDIGNDFYRLWLDKTMTYSCAYFEHPDDSLETAQMNKVRHILYKLHPAAGGRLLDIGSGWGTLIITAAKEFHLKTIGITLSEEQYEYTKKQIQDNNLQEQVEVRLMDYRDLKDEQFDYVTSVGMFEHVGKENLGLYFKKIKELLIPNGRALIHGITGQHQGVGVDPFLNKYIFPGGYIPNMAENLVHIMDAGLQLNDLEPLRRHYQATLEHWYHNYHKVFDQTAQRYGKDFARMWDLYLQGAAASFEAGNIDVMQFLVTNGPSGIKLPMTRNYIYEHELN